MPFRRGRDHLVVLVVLGILVVVAVNGFRGLKAQAAARDCLVRLSAAAAGPLPADAACPLSGKAYPTSDPIRCPEPGSHLPTDPRYVGGRPTQSFPASPADGLLRIPEWSAWAKVDATPEGIVVTRSPRFWWRYVVGPLLQLIGLAIGLLLLALVGIEAGRRPLQPLQLAIYAVGLVLVGLLTWHTIRSAWGRETWTFDPRARTVRHQRYVAGRAWGAPTLHADLRALAPVRGTRTMLVLVGKDGKAVELFAVQPEAVGALAPLHDAIFPGR